MFASVRLCRHLVRLSRMTRRQQLPHSLLASQRLKPHSFILKDRPLWPLTYSVCAAPHSPHRPYTDRVAPRFLAHKASQWPSHFTYTMTPFMRSSPVHLVVSETTMGELFPKTFSFFSTHRCLLDISRTSRDPSWRTCCQRYVTAEWSLSWKQVQNISVAFTDAWREWVIVS